MCIYYIFAPYYCPSHNAYILLFCLFQGYRYHKLKQAKLKSLEENNVEKKGGSTAFNTEKD